MQNKSAQKTTHFGYETIPAEEKTQRVNEVFHAVAQKYDLMNDLMSLGIHRLWKRFALEFSGVRQGQTVLDLAGGTGDLALKLSRITGSSGLVVLTDINESMLQVGRDRLLDRGIAAVQYVQANAESLPFPDDSFHCITIGFGLRNVTDKSQALAEMYRVLRPGGRLLVLEFSKPTHPLFGKIYDNLSLSILPRLGKWIAQDEKSYRYLAQSIHMHPDQKTLKNMMMQVGFCRCDYHNLSGGIVALHRGFKA